MTERMERRLLDLKARQQAEEHMLCPRCGADTMKEPVCTNALSRVADLYAADLQCAVAPVGHVEALMADVKGPDVFGVHKVFLLALCAV